jgi:hypothetical protein
MTVHGWDFPNLFPGILQGIFHNSNCCCCVIRWGFPQFWFDFIPDEQFPPCCCVRVLWLWQVSYNFFRDSRTTACSFYAHHVIKNCWVIMAKHVLTLIYWVGASLSQFLQVVFALLALIVCLLGRYWHILLAIFISSWNWIPRLSISSISFLVCIWL